MRSIGLEALLVLTLVGVGCTPPDTGPERMEQASAQQSAEWYFWTDDGVRHYVREIGSGPDTVVVLHGGWGAEHSYLIPALDPFSDGHTFVLYDQRGSLRSPAPDSTITMSRLVADLEHLRQSLGSEAMTLYTHSMGAQLSYAYLRDYPLNVRGMVLQAPVLPRDAPVDSAAAAEAWTGFVAFAQANERKQATAEGLMLDQLTDRQRSARSRLSLAAGNIYHVERWRSVRGGQAFYNRQVAVSLEQNSSDSDWTGLAQALLTFSGPVTVIMGDHDLTDFGLVNWPTFAAFSNNLEFEVLNQAGHNAWIDQPAAHEAALRRALSRASLAGEHGDSE